MTSNYKQEKFGSICDLCSIADKFKKVRAVCVDCLKESQHSRKDKTSSYDSRKDVQKAPFTKRLTTETEAVVVGGAEKYQPTCRICLYQK